MNTVTEIERAIEQLPPEDFVRLRDWLAEHDAARWDQQIERDVASGRLGSLAIKALDDLASGRALSLP